MATLKGQTIAASYQDLVKRADSYSQTGTNIELMTDSNGTIAPTGLYLESGATTDFVGIGVADPDTALEIFDTTTQLKLSFDATDFCTFGVDTNHDLTITPSSTGQIKLKPTTDSVDFFQVLDADAGTPILNVDSTNERVGIGTDSPDSQLEIVSAASTNCFVHIDTTTDNFDAGLLFYNSNVRKWSIYNDGTGLTGEDTLVFQDESDDLTLVISQNGGVGIGTTGPASKLHVVADPGNNNSLVIFQNNHADVDDDDTILMLQFSADTDIQNDTGSGHFITFADNNNTNMGAIIADSATAISSTLSDYRKKENISLMSSGLTEINNLKPSTFNFKDYTKVMNGFIAHEVQEVISGAVFGDKDAVDDDGEIKPQLLATEKLIPFMVKAIQELSAKVEALENA